MENVNTKIVIEFAPKKGFRKDQYKFEKLKNRINERIEHHKTLINDFKFIKIQNVQHINIQSIFQKNMNI